jgi:arginase
MANYICIGVPYYIGEQNSERSEVEAMKASGIVSELGAQWVDIQPDFADGLHPVIAINRALADTIAAYPDHIPLIFASDCVSALGAMKGLERFQPAVLWYDAHGDFNTWETTPSGFLGGMPLAMLVGRGDMSYMQGVGLAPMREKDVMISDARDLDPDESVSLLESFVNYLPDIDDLLTEPLPTKPLYVHFDTDVVDVKEMPAVGYPAPGGPTVEQTAATLRRVARDANIAGVLFSLWNNTLPGADRSYQATLQLVRALTANNK